MVRDLWRRKLTIVGLYHPHHLTLLILENLELTLLVLMDKVDINFKNLEILLFNVMKMLDVNLGCVNMLGKAGETFMKIKSFGRYLFSLDTLRCTLNSCSSMTTTSFLSISYSLIVPLFGFGNPYIIEEIESHNTKSLVVDINIDSPWFTLNHIKRRDIKVLEDESKEKTIRKRGSLIFYGINHFMDNEV
ncbi:hypothetical protein PanWU01x14_014250 [Parasponia andersonii]|uniref:Uncharacterized protein n=1 Tax=Parasponia andersonii TaxID=3476 RepID=A0A2P5E054_PARAD|nr:hypothetical protein PanWU01x14_014250 [Parasponia andersonii]